MSFALVDCNNFYVSCERLFNPKLEGKAVVALSQNDGCIIARSEEAKRLGLKMGEPYFMVKEYCERTKVIVFSSNYQLYGDISARVMNILAQAGPEMEVYSIDEAFLKFPASLSPEEMFAEGMRIRKQVKKWVGIPVSIGIAPTKTLAKVANYIVKKKYRDLGVYHLGSPAIWEEVLKSYPTEEVWGIGSRLSRRLRGMGIFTAWEFSQMDPYLVRKKMGVVGERMLWELRGVPALTLQESAPKQSIAFTRSFGKPITEVTDLSEALATFTAKACIKLRGQDGFASAIQVFLERVSFEQSGEREYSTAIKAFDKPTNDTPLMITAAKQCLHQLYEKEGKYKRGGVILLDIIPEDCVEADLFLGGVEPKRNHLMHTVDALNERFGKYTVFFGAMGMKQNWKSRSERPSQYNTTSWDQLPIVYAKR